MLVPDPGPGEVLVRVQACGVCHTDLHYREGAINDEFPFLLGHEASGKVEAVGPDVTNVAPGDFVVLAWRAPCGQCRSCLRGRPWYCFDSRNASQKMTLEDGTPLSAAIGIGAFAEVCLVAAGQAVKVDPAARPEAAGLVGCGIMAGYGAIMNTAKVERGDTVAVFGCGGVGNAAIHAAALVGARKVIAVDVDQRKLELARQFGATDLVDSSQVNPVSAVRELTGGFGADVTVEAVGRPEVMKQAFHARDHAGTHDPERRPQPQDADRPRHARLLRARRGAAAVLVRRLPAHPRLPDIDRPVPARPLRSRPVRLRDHRPRPGRGGVRQDATQRGAALGGGLP